MKYVNLPTYAISKNINDMHNIAQVIIDHHIKHEDV